MKKILFALMCLSYPSFSYADNVILMIGDGMGENHLKCAEKEKSLYITTLPVKGYVQTRSADNDITDSAASATAYACGIKTNNGMIGKMPSGEDCQTIAEKAVQNRYAAGVYSTDYSTGATPSAFYAHASNRYERETIKAHKEKASASMDIQVPVKKLSASVLERLNHLSSLPDKNGFFAMFEGALIDSYSHGNQPEKMKQELYDFDASVMNAASFVNEHPETTLIVLADHETGGLNDECIFTSRDHTGTDILVYAYGKHAYLFSGYHDNTEIHQKMENILFNEK